MPIPFKAPAVSALLNQTFLNKTIDDAKKGKLSLYKNLVSDPDAIDDIQDFINEIADTIGQDGEDDPNRKIYTSTEIISNGQSRKEAIEALDAQVKLNLDSIAFLNSLVLAGSAKLKSYISDNAYELDNPPLEGGEIYYNTTTGFVRYYNFLETEWQDIGKSVLAVQEQPTGLLNGVNQNFDITNSPINDEAINVFVNGLLIPKTDWTFLSPTITLNFAPAVSQFVYVSYLTQGNPATPVISAGTNNVIYHQLTAGEITAKQFTFPSTPVTPSHLLVDVIGGLTVIFGTDFSVTGDIFEWDGLGLDGLLNSGDILRIQYFN